jgi:hypothetical protein
MLAPDFSRYSLALIKDGAIIYEATGPGLRPLAECVLKLSDKVEGCILHDKVVGLAAARLAVWSGMVDKIVAGMMSESARTHLMGIEFPFAAMETVPMILNKDQTGMCPMEQIAAENPGDEEMWEKIRERLKL